MSMYLFNLELLLKLSDFVALVYFSFFYQTLVANRQVKQQAQGAIIEQVCSPLGKNQLSRLFSNIRFHKHIIGRFRP